MMTARLPCRRTARVCDVKRWERSGPSCSLDPSVSWKRTAGSRVNLGLASRQALGPLGSSVSKGIASRKPPLLSSQGFRASKGYVYTGGSRATSSLSISLTLLSHPLPAAWLNPFAEGPGGRISRPSVHLVLFKATICIQDHHSPGLCGEAPHPEAGCDSRGVSGSMRG